VADSLGGVVGAERPLGKGPKPNFSLSSLLCISFLPSLSVQIPHSIIVFYVAWPMQENKQNF